MGTFDRKAFDQAIAKRDGITADDIARAISETGMRPGTTAKDVRTRLRAVTDKRVGRGGSWVFDLKSAGDLAELVVTSSRDKGTTILVTSDMLKKKASD